MFTSFFKRKPVSNSNTKVQGFRPGMEALEGRELMTVGLGAFFRESPPAVSFSRLESSLSDLVLKSPPVDATTMVKFNDLLSGLQFDASGRFGGLIEKAGSSNATSATPASSAALQSTKSLVENSATVQAAHDQALARLGYTGAAGAGKPGLQGQTTSAADRLRAELAGSATADERDRLARAQEKYVSARDNLARTATSDPAYDDLLSKHNDAYDRYVASFPAGWQHPDPTTRSVGVLPSPRGAVQVNPRLPDYIYVNGGIDLGRLGSVSVQVTVDRDAHIYAAPNYSPPKFSASTPISIAYPSAAPAISNGAPVTVKTPFSVSLMAGWLNQNTRPNEEHLQNFLSGASQNYIAGNGLAVGRTESFISNRQGANTSTEFGISTPQVGGSVGYSLDVTPSPHRVTTPSAGCGQLPSPLR